MPEGQIHVSPPLAFIPTLEAAITRNVELNAGIRDTALTILVLVEITDHPLLQSQKDGSYAAAMIAWTVHRMILSGQLVAIDCETKDTSYTYILPALSRTRMAIPIRIADNRTRH